MQIKIIQTNVSEAGTGNRAYKVLEVTYRNLFDNKVASKKVMSFASPAVFALLKDAAAETTFDIKSEKDSNGYWQWTAATPTDGSAPAAAAETPSGKSGKSTYETPEERAKKQIYIVRQSSLANAIALLSHNNETGKGNNPFSVDEAVAVAKRFETYVLGTDPMDAITGMADDVPV